MVAGLARISNLSHVLSPSSDNLSNTLFNASLILSAVTNVVATLLIAYKLWFVVYVTMRTILFLISTFTGSIEDLSSRISELYIGRHAPKTS